jgi:phospholipase C
MSDATAGATARDPIEHVVLLLMENHSFDQMLGCTQALYPQVDGVGPAPQRSNPDADGTPVPQLETRALQMPLDPKHEHADVMTQLAGGNQGFVRDFAQAHPQATPADKLALMGYYPLDFLPAMHALARDFTVCDQWFSSLPGPTWPNRFFALTGTCNGRTAMPAGLNSLEPNWYMEQTQPTLFDRLNDAGKPWKIYYYDFPCSLLLVNQRKRENLARYRKIDEFFDDARGDAAAFPAFTFIEPKYFGVDQNDDHPPHNIMKAEKLIADVYNALRSNTPLWNSTLLVVLFDEHGGFYDHVPPPAAVPPDARRDDTGFGFDRLGVRVPAMLVSPWVTRGCLGTRFDHTSLLKYLQMKWGLGALGDRTAAAVSIGGALNATAPRDDTVPFIRVPNSLLISPDIEKEKNDSNANQDALHAFADFLHAQADGALAGGLGAAVEVARFDNPWTRGKDAVGQALTKLGHWLSAGQQVARKQREERSSQAVERLKQAAAPDQP